MSKVMISSTAAAAAAAARNLKSPTSASNSSASTSSSASASASASLVLDEKDPERALKLKECCDLLLAGGYFRARINTLSPFDKVVGGIVWAMTASAVDLDVDIIFQENSTIGQRIRLSDQICRTLVHMRCPYPLQSHQIQGLDYDHLFPVLQWLVRKVIETRRLMGDVVRAQSKLQFSKQFSRFSEECIDTKAYDQYSKVTRRYRTQRKLKKKATANFENGFAKVEATLLEYGERSLGGVALDDDENKEEKRGQKTRSNLIAKFEQKGPNADAKDDEESRRKAEEEAAARLKALEDQLSAAGISLDKLSGADVGNIVGMQADEIRKAAGEYEAILKAQADALEASGALTKKGQEAAHQRQLDAARRKIAAAQEDLKKRQESLTSAEAQLDELRTALAKKEAYNERVLRETEKLDAIENEGTNREILQKLRTMVSMNETLKAQEAAFKGQCAAERADLLASLSNMESADGDEETKRMLEIEAIYDSDLAKLNKIRRVLAKKNQDISRIVRQIDDIPTRAELLQYERRFIELYELVAAKLSETRKYFSMYNTLSDSHRYMSQEVTLLNSIIDAFPKAMAATVTSGSRSSRDQLLEQLEKILDGVDKTKTVVKSQSDSEQGARDASVAKYNALLEKQRNYFKAVKEFQDECTKNEKLTAALENETEPAPGATSSADEESSD